MTQAARESAPRPGRFTCPGFALSVIAGRGTRGIECLRDGGNAHRAGNSEVLTGRDGRSRLRQERMNALTNLLPGRESW